MDDIKKALLQKHISSIKQEMADCDFNDPKSMTNLCSYLAIKVGEKIIDMGYSEYATLHLSINDEKLDNSTHLKQYTDSNHHHNVVLFDGYVIDLTRKQFGNLVSEDITTLKEYLELGWQLKHTTIFKKQKVKKLQRKYNN